MIWAIAATVLGAITALFVLTLVRGTDERRRIVNAVDAVLDDDPADQMSPDMRDRFDAWKRHTDEALHVANDCVVCEFDSNRRKATP